MKPSEAVWRNRQPSPRRSAPAGEIKVLITALSLAATVGGLAAFSQGHASVSDTSIASAATDTNATSVASVDSGSSAVSVDTATPSVQTQQSSASTTTSAPAAVAVSRSSR